MSVGKASIARAVNAEKTAKTEEKVAEVKEAEEIGRASCRERV